ncbi:7-cyano-7-deazaguanine synthase QueC [Verrucomicrobia bacterium LW23]|nr:7-cyano-7-deazaguanine synthase QueC [Verrucomicrobia bacterium LW23]
MDSVTALYVAARDHKVVGTVSFHYGSKHNDSEIPMAAWHSAHLGIPYHVITLDFIGKFFQSNLLRTGGEIPEGHYEEETMKQTVVPFRNGIMLSIAAGYAESIGAQALVIAAHAGDHAIYPDCREDFMQAMADSIRLGTYADIQLLRPFIAETKAGIARIGAGLSVDYRRTWSCYKGGALHCGKCGTCVERREAFALARLPDPTSYEETPPLPEKPAIS